MKTVVIGEKKIGLRATPLALLYYKQAFDKDLMADLVSMTKMADVSEDDFSQFDSLKLLQVAWAMNKADNLGKPFSDFENWLSDLESIDFADESWQWDVVNEAEAGFFRSARDGGKSK